MRRVIVAVDPGQTTGVARASYEVGSDVLVLSGGGWEIKNIEGYVALETLLREAPPDLVIVESFNLRPDEAQSQVGSAFPSVEGIGIMKFICFELGVKMLLQTPGEKSMIADSDLMKYLDLNHLMSSLHIRDALRHITYFMLKEKYGRR